MTNLRILIIRRTRFTPELNYLPNSLKLLDWEEYPSKSLPLGLDQIGVLNLPQSHLTLEEAMPFQNLVHLTHFDFSRCYYITHFPDVSGVPNLSELNLTGCRNLTAIHHSVGCHQKLKSLVASVCDNLEVFPPMMSLPSLQRLDLDFTSIAFFPHIEEGMCAPLTISLIESPIKKLPNSISKLTGLKRIEIISRSLTRRGLPSELFMLPEMEVLHLADCGVAVRKSLRRLRNSHALSYSPLRELCCYNCRLTDEDLDIILSCFPNLQELEVPSNSFVSLPQSIEGSANLKLLDVSACLMLEEIPKLPKSVKEVRADGCLSLSSEACKTLWSQVKNEVYELEIVMPRTTDIPRWFDHRCEEGIVSFWARGKFPVLAVAFILKEDTLIGETRIHINGDLYEPSHGDLHDPSHFPIGDTIIFDLRCMFSVGKWEILDTFLVHEWNHVVIECKRDELDCSLSECECELGCKCEIVSSCGAYVYKKETNMEDIRFTCPSSLKRTLSIVDDDDSPKRNRGEEAQA